MSDELLGLRGSLPEAHRKKMATMRGGANAGRGDNPHHVQEDSDDLDIPHGLKKSKDFSSSNLPFKRVN